MRIGKEFNRGFTLVELLVVIAIIAMLLSILMPALGRVRAQGRQVVCLSNMRQCGQGLLLYAMENNDFIVSGRWNKNNDPTSMNAWYCNLTPYLDSSKKPNKDVYMLPSDEAARYNEIWAKLKCPAQEKYITRHGVGQGIDQLTFAINIGASYALHGYKDGFGLFDWYTGESRKNSKIKHPGEVMAFTDMRDVEYTYSGHYYMMKSSGRYDPEWFMPVRHPRGFVVGFADGHSGMVEQQIIKDKDRKYTENPLWKAQ